MLANDRIVPGQVATEARQEQAHCRALVHFALNGDMAPGLFAEAIDHRQPQAGALADRLGGEERIEGAADGALRHAAAIVGDTEYHVVTRFEVAVGFGEAGVQLLVRGPHHQFAAIGHGIAGVDDQVEQGTFQLIGIGLGHPQVLAQLHFQTDAFVDAALQQFAHGNHQVVHLHRFGIQRLATGERQQTVSQARRAIGRGHAKVDQAVQILGAATGQTPAQQLQATDDARQHVVEVMGDTASELADCLHFLRLAQHFFVLTQLCGAFFDLLLKGFEGVLQAQFALAQVDQPVPGLVLSSTSAQRSGHQADQCLRMKGPLKEGDIAQLRAKT